jgi:hypothetical protein
MITQVRIVAVHTINNIGQKGSMHQAMLADGKSVLFDDKPSVGDYVQIADDGEISVVENSDISDWIKGRQPVDSGELDDYLALSAHVETHLPEIVVIGITLDLEQLVLHHRTAFCTMVAPAPPSVIVDCIRHSQYDTVERTHDEALKDARKAILDLMFRGGNER